MQTISGIFIRFATEEIPEKKKGAVGVRGMKLIDKDMVEAVYYLQSGKEHTIEYKSKTLDLSKIKLSKRDTKGVKVRT